MKYIYAIIGLTGLLLLIVPAILYFRGNMDPGQMKNLMFIGTLVWFAAAIPLLGRKKETES